MLNNLELLQVKDKLADILLSSNTGNQVGVGVNEKEDMVRVYLRQETEKGKQHVQSLIGGNTANGYEIQYIPIGHVSALVSPFTVFADRLAYHRPLYGGDSIGNQCVGAGTNGCLVYDANTKEKYLLSNNHVFACSSTYNDIKANIGDTIFAPGCLDAGCTYPIGTLHKFIPYNSSEKNFVDVALVKPNLDTDISDEIVGLGVLNGWKKPEQNMQIIKSGRTSGITQGNIIDIWATIEVDYNGSIILMSDTIITTKTGDAGDSGSIGMSPDDNKALGILFAGSPEITCYNRIENVMAGLNILITPNDVMPAATGNLGIDVTSQVSEFGSVAFGIAAIGLAGKYVFDAVTKHT